MHTLIYYKNFLELFRTFFQALFIKSSDIHNIKTIAVFLHNIKCNHPSL